MTVKKEKTLDMLNGPLLPAVMAFSLPLMATNILQMLFNAADTVIVGKFAGQNALAAVGATGSLIQMFICLFVGMSMGANVVVAQEIGAGRKENISRASHTAVLMGFFGGLIVMILGLLFSRFMLQMLSTPSDIIDGSALYLRIYFLGGIFLILYNFGSGILRAKGDTKRPFYFLLVSGILNVVLNLFFVIVLKMSVAGVAIATVVSQGVSALLVLLVLCRDTDDTHIELRKLRIDPVMFRKILAIGIPSGIQSMAYAITNIVVQSSVNSFGSSTIVAGNTAAANIESFIYTGMMAFSNAALTFTSQNIGAGRTDRLLKILWLTLILDCGSAFVIGLIANLNGSAFLSLYTNSPEVIEAGKIRLLYVGMFLSLNAVLDIFGYTLRGMGHSTLPAVILIGGVTVIRLAWLSTVFRVYHELRFIYMCYPVSWLIASILTGAAYFVIYRREIRNH